MVYKKEWIEICPHCGFENKMPEDFEPFKPQDNSYVPYIEFECDNCKKIIKVENEE